MCTLSCKPLNHVLYHASLLTTIPRCIYLRYLQQRRYHGINNGLLPCKSDQQRKGKLLFRSASINKALQRFLGAVFITWFPLDAAISRKLHITHVPRLSVIVELDKRLQGKFPLCATGERISLSCIKCYI